MSLQDELDTYGSEGYRNNVRKFARVDGFSGTGVMWDGANGIISQPDYQGWLEAEEIVEAVSTSINDAVGGSGAYALQIRGQAEDGIEKTEVIILQGQVPVQSVGKFSIIYSAQVINTDAVTNGNTSPINGCNDGQVTVYPASQITRIMAAILPNLGRTQMAVWRCPKNKYAEFQKIGVYPQSGKPIIGQLFARNSINESWINVGQLDEDGFLTEPSWPEGNREYITPGTDLCLVIVTAQSTNASSLLWVKMFDIENYEQLLEEAMNE